MILIFHRTPLTTRQRINELENGPSSYVLKKHFLAQIAWVLMF